MTTIFYEDDADPDAIAGQTIAVVGYGNQGRSWAMNLRDSGLAVRVCVRSDPSRDAAVADGFDVHDVRDASSADVLCVLVPDDVVPSLGLSPRADKCTIVASGRLHLLLGHRRFEPAQFGDVAAHTTSVGAVPPHRPRVRCVEVRSGRERGPGGTR